MSRLKKFAAAASATAAAVGTTIAAASGLAQAAPRPSTVVLAGSAVPFVSHGRVTGAVPGSEQLTIQLWLTPKSGAASFATAVSSPGSALFHHYLSPAAYTARFGPSAQETSAVENWLRGGGFTAVHTDAGRSYVRATGTVARIDAAFRTTVKTYKASAGASAGPYALRANDSALSLPASLAGSVLGVTGIDNAAPVTSLIASKPQASTSKCSHYYGQNMASGLPKKYGVTSFPTFICGYSAHQIRSAYQASSAVTGQGQTIALVEVGLTRDMFTTLQDYAKRAGMPAPSPLRYEQLSLGNNSCGDPFNIEEQLDVESSYDMAPGANQLVVGGDSCNTGDFGNQAEFDADVAVLDGAGGHPLASVASNSWESGPESQPKAWTKLVHAYLIRSAAEGVGMYFSAGDGSGVLEPAIDPFATGVGGTTLGIGKTGNRLFETGWSSGISALQNNAWVFKGEDGASGGGPSTLWAQPPYQKGVVPTKLGTTRSGPDISADADAFTGLAVGMLQFSKTKPPVYVQFSVGGTSESAPLVAGMVTAAEQGQAKPFGFLNPLIYKLYGTDAYFDTLPLTSHSPALYRGLDCDLVIFAHLCGGPKNLVPHLTTFDDQNPKMAGYTGQVTLKGYDNMTGVGTPDEPNFIAGLRKLAS
jgi:subtilase family serine protease